MNIHKDKTPMGMKRSRRKFSSEYKAKVVIEALKERETMAELAKRFEIHPNRITTWKKEFLTRSPAIFNDGGHRSDPDTPDPEKLYAQIGQLKVEDDFLKKNLKKLGL